MVFKKKNKEWLKGLTEEQINKTFMRVKIDGRRIRKICEIEKQTFRVLPKEEIVKRAIDHFYLYFLKQSSRIRIKFEDYPIEEKNRIIEEQIKRILTEFDKKLKQF